MTLTMMLCCATPEWLWTARETSKSIKSVLRLIVNDHSTRARHGSSGHGGGSDHGGCRQEAGSRLQLCSDSMLFLQFIQFLYCDHSQVITLCTYYARMLDSF